MVLVTAEITIDINIVNSDLLHARLFNIAGESFENKPLNEFEMLFFGCRLPLHAETCQLAVPGALSTLARTHSIILSRNLQIPFMNIGKR